jgi:kinesin family member 5
MVVHLRQTFTMFGQEGSLQSSSSTGKPVNKEGRGIIPRTCEELLQAIELRRQRDGIDAVLSVSYVEVFGDGVFDLLRAGARCGPSKAAAQRYVLNGAAEMPLESMDDVFDVLRRGEDQKRRAATAMNDRSTRAHSLFILSLKQRRPASTSPGSFTERSGN